MDFGAFFKAENYDKSMKKWNRNLTCYFTFFFTIFIDFWTKIDPLFDIICAPVYAKPPLAYLESTHSSVSCFKP